jgi:putative acetyltransferase
MNKILIRSADKNDLPAITELFRSTIQTVNAKDYTKEQIEVWSSGADNAERWSQSIKNQHFIVAEIEGTLVGFGSVTPEGYLDFMYVHKNFQRVGIARSLLNEIERKAVEQKNTEIYSDVSKTAKGFFEKLGYICREVVTDKAINGVTFENYVMVKKINLKRIKN